VSVAAVRLLVAARPATLAMCELCMVGPERLADAVLIEHAEGGAVALAACERCARAARRIAAAIGPGASTIGGEVAAAIPRTPAAPRRARAIRAVPELIRERADPFVDAEGRRFLVRVYGQQRRDGTWVGWLAFVAEDGSVTLPTDVETSQPERGAVVYWADGLQPIYIEGAFARARRRSQTD
jgi:hypothetical protein